MTELAPPVDIENHIVPSLSNQRRSWVYPCAPLESTTHTLPSQLAGGRGGEGGGGVHVADSQRQTHKWQLRFHTRGQLKCTPRNIIIHVECDPSSVSGVQLARL